MVQEEYWRRSLMPNATCGWLASIGLSSLSGQLVIVSGVQTSLLPIVVSYLLRVRRSMERFSRLS